MALVVGADDEGFDFASSPPSSIFSTMSSPGSTGGDDGVTPTAVADPMTTTFSTGAFIFAQTSPSTIISPLSFFGPSFDLPFSTDDDSDDDDNDERRSRNAILTSSNLTGREGGASERRDDDVFVDDDDDDDDDDVSRYGPGIDDGIGGGGNATIVGPDV
jgi:hypothetical protein